MHGSDFVYVYTISFPKYSIAIVFFANSVAMIPRDIAQDGCAARRW
jgi:hypothetical protein